MNPPGYPKTPMLNKMLRVQRRSQILGQFLEWYRSEDFGFETTEQTLARYFKIDLKKIEAERQLILEHIARQIQPSRPSRSSVKNS